MTDTNYTKMMNEILIGMNDRNENSFYKNYLKPEVGSVIIGRFVPNLKNPRVSKYHYFHHGWKTAKGTYVSYLCPSTYGEQCPICKKSIEMWKSGDSFQMETSKRIRRKENYVTNFYVIKDNKNAKNEGVVKLFRFGKQINDKIVDAIEGLDKDILGLDIFRLDDQGFDFRIRVTENAENKSKKFNTYASSQFITARTGIPDVGTEQIEKILSETFDLETLLPKSGFSELQAALANYMSEALGEPVGVIEKPALEGRGRQDSVETPESPEEPVSAPVPPSAPRKERPAPVVEATETPEAPADEEDELDKILRKQATTVGAAPSAPVEEDEIPF